MQDVSIQSNATQGPLASLAMSSNELGDNGSTPLVGGNDQPIAVPLSQAQQSDAVSIQSQTIVIATSVQDIASDYDELDSDSGAGPLRGHGVDGNDEGNDADSTASHQRQSSVINSARSTPVASSSAAAFNSSPRSTTSSSTRRRTVAAASQHPIPPLPHYTVVRSTNNSRTSPHRIKVNPGVTDADQNLWPTAASRQPGYKQGGKLSWYNCQPPTGNKHSKWLEGLGKELASLLKLDPPRAGGKQDHWVLDDWPEHYLFAVHHTPGKTGERGPDRQDAYLFGSPASAKFRTVNEFTPHLYWLLMHGPDDDLQCECKYCTRKTQAQVNAVVGLTNPATLTFAKRERASSSTPSAGSRPKKQQRRDPATSSALEASHSFMDLLPGFNLGDYVRDRPRRRAAVGIDESAWTSVASTSSAPRVSNSARPTGSLKKPAKPRDPAHDLPSYRGAFTNKVRDQDLSEGYKYRRGELVMVKLEQNISDPNEALVITHWPAIVRERQLVSRPGTVPSKHPGLLPQIVNKHSYQYKVELLATCDCVTRPETAIAPWLGSSTLDPTIFGDRSVLFNKVGVDNVWDLDTNSYKRCSFSALKTPMAAITALALALQIGAALRASFTLDNKYRINREHLVPLIDTPMTDQDEADMLDSLDSWHFQSIWWGAECIWSGELVRLITSDNFWTPEVQPSSTSSAPAPLDTADGRGRDQDQDQEEAAPHEHAHFLKISAIWKHHVVEDDSHVAMLSGQVYELRKIRQQAQQPLQEDSSSSSGGGSAQRGRDSAAHDEDVELGDDEHEIERKKQSKETKKSSDDGDGGDGDGDGDGNGDDHRVKKKLKKQPRPRPEPIYMPRPPAGYEFVRLSKHEMHVDASFIAGRYYPPPAHVDVARALRGDWWRATTTTSETTGTPGTISGTQSWERTAEQHDVVLAGLTPALVSYMDPTTWCVGRYEAVVNAEMKALADFCNAWDAEQDEVEEAERVRDDGDDDNGEAMVDGGPVAAVAMAPEPAMLRNQREQNHADNDNDVPNGLRDHHESASGLGGHGPGSELERAGAVAIPVAGD